MSEIEKFHRLAVEAGRIGTWDLNLQTEECLISPKMAELMGFSPEQTTVPGTQWRKSIVPEDRTLMASALAPSIASDAPFDLEFRIALKDGRQRWLYSRGAVSRDASGRTLRMYGASIDVTERKQADEKLRDSEERLRRAIEIETVGVNFFTTDGSITNANDAFLRMSGYSREDLAEGLVRWDEMTPPEWMPHSLKAIEEFESTGRTVPYEKEFVRKDGSRWWALFAARRLDEEEGVEFIIDITESKRAEEELRESGERITNILESITDAFVAVDPQWHFTYINERALTMNRVRDLVAACGVYVVLAQDRDRIAREPAYHYLLRREFEEHGTKIRAMKDRGDDSPEGELTDGILDQLGKYERTKISERSRRGKLQKAREGKVLAGRRPNYGFKLNATRNGYEVHEENMRVVRRIFEMVGVENRTLHAVSRALEREGEKSPDGKPQWATPVIRHLILNDVYRPHSY
jgi:PAS domain S-box-containing protein